METKMINTNQPESAFPSTFKSLSPEEGQAHRWGMTLRDYFAAKAMQGMFNYWHENPNLEFEHIASCSYDMADAMLKARDA
jgi:hypothetical protein